MLVEMPSPIAVPRLRRNQCLATGKLRPISRMNSPFIARTRKLAELWQTVAPLPGRGPAGGERGPDGVALAAIQGLNEKVERGKEKAQTRMEKPEAVNAESKQK
jgi:hypothetical protein